MELADILKTLWRRRLWLMVGYLLAVLTAWFSAFHITFPPTLEPRSIEFGSAMTQVLLDTRQSPLFHLDASVEPLSSRAELYVQLVTTWPAHTLISRAAGFEPHEIVVSARTVSAGTKSSREPGSEQRSDQLAKEKVEKRILFAAEEDLPIISIFTQAETANEAVQLANGGANGLVKYLKNLESRQTVQPVQRITFRQLGAPQGELVNDGASITFAVLILLVVFVLWCLGVVVVANLLSALRLQHTRGHCYACGGAVAEDSTYCSGCGESLVQRSDAVLLPAPDRDPSALCMASAGER